MHQNKILEAGDAKYKQCKTYYKNCIICGAFLFIFAFEFTSLPPLSLCEWCQAFVVFTILIMMLM